MLCLAILIKVHHLAINRDHGTGRVLMARLDRLEDPVGLVVHLSKVHQVQALVNIDHLE